MPKVAEQQRIYNAEAKLARMQEMAVYNTASYDKDLQEYQTKKVHLIR